MKRFVEVDSCYVCPFRGPTDGQADTCRHPVDPFRPPFGAVEDSAVSHSPPPAECPLRREALSTTVVFASPAYLGDVFTDLMGLEGSDEEPPLHGVAIYRRRGRDVFWLCGSLRLFSSAAKDAYVFDDAKQAKQFIDRHPRALSGCQMALFGRGREQPQQTSKERS